MLFMILLGFAFAPANMATAEPAPARTQSFTVVPPFATEESRAECPDLSPRIADERRRGMQPRRLDELPPGRLEYAVFREVDGCPIRAVVHEEAIEQERQDRR